MPFRQIMLSGEFTVRTRRQAAGAVRETQPVRRIHLVPTRANTQPALASYIGEPGGPDALPGGLFVLSLAGSRIGAVTRFHLDELYPRFGLPESLPGSAHLRDLSATWAHTARARLSVIAASGRAGNPPGPPLPQPR